MTGRPQGAPELVVFDLDGTLIDSIGDIASSANQALAEAYGDPARLPQDMVRSFVGSGARHLMERCVAAAGQSRDDVPRVFDRFLEIYRSRLTETTRLYSGMDETLITLGASARLAILTNKPGEMSRRIVKDLGLTSRFLAVIGGDDLKTKKPDPEGLLKIAADAGVSIKRVAMVGDSAVDMQTARHAGALSVAVLWGYDVEGARLSEPDVVVASPGELASALA
ncbi:MAG: HAD-IA family hydrolase [Vicinamibacteria bacterium]